MDYKDIKTFGLSPEEIVSGDSKTFSFGKVRFELRQLGMKEYAKFVSDFKILLAYHSIYLKNITWPTQEEKADDTIKKYLIASIDVYQSSKIFKKSIDNIICKYFMIYKKWQVEPGIFCPMWIKNIMAYFFNLLFKIREKNRFKIHLTPVKALEIFIMGFLFNIEWDKKKLLEMTNILETTLRAESEVSSVGLGGNMELHWKPIIEPLSS